MRDKQTALRVQLKQSQPIPLDVKLHCEQGELLALTGPSGSGKSTVLRAIAGLHHVANGSIQCNEYCWQHSQSNRFCQPQQRRVGLVFQHYALFPHLSVLDNVAVAMSHIARNQRRDKAMSWLRLANMDGLHNKPPARLSGGQRQRVALARALAREPDVLLLDEPFSAVDQLTREKLYRELAQIRANLSIPMILVTHDMQEVQQLADSLCLMHHGQTLQLGPVSQVVRRPNTCRVASLIGHKNIYSGRLSANGTRGRLDTTGIQIDLPHLHGMQSGAVSVLIPPAAIIMHRNDRPSNGERENPILTQVTEAIELGDDLALKMQVVATGETMEFRISRHVANRNRVMVGKQLRVSIMLADIHLMPADSRLDANQNNAGALYSGDTIE